MKEWLEYAAVWLILKALGALPRTVARVFAASVTSLFFRLQPKFRKTAEFNLRLAFPDWTDAERKDATRKMVRNLGWMAAEFARFPRLTKENVEKVVILEGHENFLEGQRRGNGVLYLTGHIGACQPISLLLRQPAHLQKRIRTRYAENSERLGNHRHSR
jgi:KDO2-lipid IV(A) lauroyltransferase